MSNVRQHNVRLLQAPNAALVLVVAGWLSGTYGVLSQLGDPAPWVSLAELRARHLVSSSFLSAGLSALVASVWLSGFSFRVAPKRASLALLCCVVPVAVLLLATFRFGR